MLGFEGCAGEGAFRCERGLGLGGLVCHSSWHLTEVGPPERDKTEGSQEPNDVWVRGRSASNRLY
jgi:hypothetical protein